VQTNPELTLDFDNAESFELHHYAFHVSDEEFDAIFTRVQEAGSPGSDPWSLENQQLNSRKGGRGVYFAIRTATFSNFLPVLRHIENPLEFGSGRPTILLLLALTLGFQYADRN
jgi:hypothetical protein